MTAGAYTPDPRVAKAEKLARLPHVLRAYATAIQRQYGELSPIDSDLVPTLIRAADALSGPGLIEDEAKAMIQLINSFAVRPMATGLSHLTGLLIRDAGRWDALVNVGRMRWQGSAGNPVHHFGMDFWIEHPDPSNPETVAKLVEFADRAAHERMAKLRADYRAKT